METQDRRPGADQARRAGSALAVSLCLAIGLILITSGAALAISGYGSGGPAALAQYPDATSPAHPGQEPAVSSIGDIMRSTPATHGNPKLVARWRVTERAIVKKASSAIGGAAGFDPPQSGSVVLLVAGMIVLLTAGFIRWRRGIADS